MKSPLLALCVATCQRPRELERLLRSLAACRVPQGLRLELRLVDNAPEGEARGVLAACAPSFPAAWTLRFAEEPERNIAHARNRALELGPAELFAFVDDDEQVLPSWLEALVEALRRQDADAVFGPVLRRLPAEAPGWVRRGGFFRAELPRGRLSWQRCRSGNALVRGAWFSEWGLRFDPAFGRSGGEDVHLFRRMELLGARLCAAPSAVAWEPVSPERLSFAWLFARRRRAGATLERIGGGRPAALTCGVRLARGGLRTLRGTPELLRGRPERCAEGLLDLALALGGGESALGLTRVASLRPYGETRS